MKTTLRKRLSYLLLSLLGFASACDREPVEMYGVPRADTRTQGRVTDKSGNPIPGIQVRSNGAPSKAVRTMADGSYDIADESASRTAWLTFTDTDGKRRPVRRKERRGDIHRSRPHGKGRRLVRGQFRPHRRRRHAGREKIDRTLFKTALFIPALSKQRRE